MSSIWTIRRSTSDVKLAGLCGGIARHWGVDPVLVRVGFALLALSGGVGLVLYVAGWLLLPADGRDTAPADDLFGAATRKWPREVWIAIVSIACVAALALSGGLTFGIGPVLVIAVIWYFGFYRPRTAQRDGGRAAPPAPSAIQPSAPPTPFRYPGPPTPFTEAAEAWQRRIAEYQGGPASPPGQPGWSWPAPPPGNLAPGTTPVIPAPPGPAAPVSAAEPEQVQRAAFLATPDPVGLYSEPVASNTTGSSVVRPVRRLSARRLGWATLLMLGVTLAGLGLADNLGATITPTVYAAAALLVVGLALVLATWLGRARGLLPIGAVLTIGVLGLSAAGHGLPGLPPSVVPATHVAYTAAADLPADGDHLDAGKLTVDLSRLPIRTDTTYKARVDLGRVDVLVPRDAQVVVRYTADAGEVTAFARPVAEGTELSGLVTDPQPLRPDRPTLTLDLGVDLGTVQVRR
jgi:phage shock protein PspC (stress-responsive transcriptional regulator)